MIKNLPGWQADFRRECRQSFFRRIRSRRHQPFLLFKKLRPFGAGNNFVSAIQSPDGMAAFRQSLPIVAQANLVPDDGELRVVRQREPLYVMPIASVWAEKPAPFKNLLSVSTDFVFPQRMLPSIP